MAKKQFKAESKKLMDLMINSIYTNREIFLREIISNASDAIDKLYFKSLTEGISGMDRSDFAIRVAFDKDARTITVSDNGIGMTSEELEKNLGTIAKSGSLDFKTTNEAKEDIDIIGQFGVGFYSVFMVASHVKVISKAFGLDEANVWESDGCDGFTINPDDKASNGTDIIITLKPDTDDDNYSEFLNEYRLRQMISHYSDYIHYPIVMNVEKSRPVEATEEQKADPDYEPDYETYYEDETVNSMIPIWKKKKSEITDEQYNEFYKQKFYDWTDPIRVIHSNIEGGLNYNALMFIPSQTPYNFYSKNFEKGLQLYSSGVLIMEKCADLLPDYFSFVRGLVDSSDLSLNISRETLQQNRQLKAIAVRIEKKIKSELETMLTADREKYEKFYEEFGLQLKYGAYSDYGTHKEVLQDLLLYRSSTRDKLVSFKEYVDNMKPDQKYIYYVCADTYEKAAKLPQAEYFSKEGFEVLFCKDNVDEFVFKTLLNYDSKEFKNIADSDSVVDSTDEEKEKIESKTNDNKQLLEKMKELLGGRVTDVRLTSRLVNHVCCFASGDNGLSLQMEKVLNSQPTGEKVKAEKILEINSEHGIFTKLSEAYNKDPEDPIISDYANILYSMASLMEGLTLDDPSDFCEAVSKLM